MKCMMSVHDLHDALADAGVAVEFNQQTAPSAQSLALVPAGHIAEQKADAVASPHDDNDGKWKLFMLVRLKALPWINHVAGLWQPTAATLAFLRTPVKLTLAYFPVLLIVLAVLWMSAFLAFLLEHPQVLLR